MYIGVEMEAIPIPTPPRMRKAMKTQISCGRAVPTAETKNMRAERRRAGLRPNRSERGPTRRTPAAQPTRTQPEAHPFMKSPRANLEVRGSIAPEMTPVS